MDSVILCLRMNSMYACYFSPGFINKQLDKPIKHAMTNISLLPILIVIGFIAIETKKPEMYIMIGIRATFKAFNSRVSWMKSGIYVWVTFTNSLADI